jgi:hypothetical protein
METSTPVCSGSIRVNIVGLLHLEQGRRNIARVLIIFATTRAEKLSIDLR